MNKNSVADRKHIEAIISFIKNNKERIKNLVIFLFIGVLVNITFYLIFKNFTFNAFKNVFQDFVTGPDMLLFLYVGIIYDLIFICTYFIFSIYRKILLKTKIGHIWLETTLVLIILSGTIGYFFLTGFMLHDLSSYLRDSKNGTIVGELNCTDSSGHFLVGSMVTCYVKQPNLYNFTTNITFTLSNDTSFTKSENNTISFISPPSMKRIEFNIVGLDKSNSSIILSTARDFEFYTESQYNDKKGQFITYLIGIFTIILIIIPSMMANFKTLCKRD